MTIIQAIIRRRFALQPPAGRILYCKGGAGGSAGSCGCASCEAKRVQYAASTPLKRTAEGKHVSVHSKTGLSECSSAVSAWRTGKGSAEVHKTLAHCRSVARGKAQAHLQRAAGHELRAQHIEHIMKSGAPVTAKGRKARAGTLKETLASRRAARAGAKSAPAPAPRPKGTILDLSRGVNARESDGPGVHVTTEAHSGWSHGWLAAMTPHHDERGPTHGRDFFRPDSTDLSRAGNGAKHYHDVPEGVYEADSVRRSFSPHRAFFHVKGGQVEHLSEDEAVARVHGMSVPQLHEARAGAKRALDEKLAAQAKAAAESAKSSGLPELKGSDKQVQWANQIRAAKLDDARHRAAVDFESIDNDPEWDAEEKAGRKKRAQDAVDRLHAQSSAGWWIDRRSSSVPSMLRELTAGSGSTRTTYARNSWVDRILYARNGDLTPARLRAAERSVERNPTEAQKESGNYAKGHVRWKGIPITIETAKGQVRRGVDGRGKPWSARMRAAYGYIKRTESEADGDHIDVFLGDDLDSELVFVVNQHDADGSGSFDEHKCMIGCSSMDDAKDLYLANYSKGWKGFGSIVPMTLPEFRRWIESGDTARPVEGRKPASGKGPRSRVMTAVERVLYARATPLVSHNGKLVSANSKAKSSECSQAASEWRRGQTTDTTYKVLARCRAMAAGHKQAGLHRAAGNDAKAQTLEHRADTGKVGNKRRAGLLAEARSKRAEKTKEREQTHSLTKAREIAERGQALTDRAKASGRKITIKPPTPAEREARDRVADVLNARHDLNRAIGEGATPGFRVAVGESIKRKHAAAQQALKAARAEQRGKVGPKVAPVAEAQAALPGTQTHATVPAPIPATTPAAGRPPIGTAPGSFARHYTNRELGEMSNPPKTPERADPPDLATFAGQAKAAGNATGKSGRFGADKVFVGDLHRTYQSMYGPISLERFKARLSEANNKRHLDVSRADMVEAMDPAKVRESESTHTGTSAQFHFLRVPPNPVSAPLPPSSTGRYARGHRSGH